MSIVKQPKGRSKPKADLQDVTPTQAPEQVQEALPAVNRKGRGPSKAALARRKRFERQPRQGRLMILHAESDDPNMRLRWADTSPQRIGPLLDRGYQPVSRDGVEINVDALMAGENVGSVITKRVGQGKEQILLEIPREWWEADRHAKKERSRQREAAIRGPIEGGYGEGVKTSVRVGQGEPDQPRNDSED